jgi:hypothetical protein
MLQMVQINPIADGESINTNNTSNNTNNIDNNMNSTNNVKTNELIIEHKKSSRSNSFGSIFEGNEKQTEVSFHLLSLSLLLLVSKEILCIPECLWLILKHFTNVKYFTFIFFSLSYCFIIIRSTTKWRKPCLRRWYANWLE